MTTAILPQPGDEAVLDNVDEDVFDYLVSQEWAEVFLNNPLHYIAVALDDDLAVGMATAVHYFHPDKPPELWINEIGVAKCHRNRGLGKQLMEAVFEAGNARSVRKLGC